MRINLERIILFQALILIVLIVGIITVALFDKEKQEEVVPREQIFLLGCEKPIQSITMRIDGKEKTIYINGCPKAISIQDAEPTQNNQWKADLIDGIMENEND